MVFNHFEIVILIGKKNTVRNFLKLGIEPEKVAEVAELSIEEVLELKKRIRKLNIKIIYNVCII
ncbi:hypothetical protein KQI42_20500 [Tissierella sp. MSJ-40]|uniref:Uncharacterized protein n=1 Tax=Tissierella simiarum TaxID=2841534 RepID=A0ABS6ED39_9FIRM|nr:hypothetical protein [Tissierella simiarum]MBU5440380.1 hypothetical protein [Tissierella simiarum]